MQLPFNYILHLTHVKNINKKQNQQTKTPVNLTNGRQES